MNISTLTTEHVDQSAPTENSWILLAVITGIGLLLTFAGQNLLLSDELYFNALAEQMTFEQIKATIDQNYQWSWLTYVILPLFNLLKFSLIAACLSLGYYFSTTRWIFKAFFRVAIQAELVLFLPALIKLLWFLFIQTDYSLNDLQFFYPLSLLNLFALQEVDKWLLYPLQLANLFEVIYWVVLAYGISQVIDIPMQRAFGLVVTSYGTGLLVWVTFVMFLSVSLS